MGKMSLAAHYQLCPVPSQLCCVEEHKKQKWAMAMAPLGLPPT